MNWWSIIIGAIGAATGIGSLLIAQLAHRTAQKSNSIAQRALTEAAKANRIAIEANKLAKDANTVSERALHISSEDFEYQWVFRVNNDGRVNITNLSSHEALNLTMLVEAQPTGKPIGTLASLYREESRVASGTELTFYIESICPELISKTRAQRRQTGAFIGNELVYNGRKPIVFGIVVILTWTTPGGRNCGDTLKHRVSYRENRGGVIVFSLVK